MAERLIVLDSAHPLARHNRCFEPELEFTGCGHAIHVRLAREARRRGMDAATADVYLAMPERPDQAVCLTDMVTPFTDRLLSRGARPAICMSLESPLNAKRFYHNIVRYAGRFRHNYQFRGTEERLAHTGTVFHPIVFPVETRVPLPLRAWSTRDHLVLVNSNKRVVHLDWASARSVARSVASQARYWYLRAIDPWMRSREVYSDRIEAIGYFSFHSALTLYGIGWDQSIPGFGSEYVKAARQVWAGPLEYERKREVMGGFKFGLCFENCVFPGYITEKISDCFLSGCVPVYFGAPDIVEVVPPETFVDYRKFDSYADLDQFLRGMTESEAGHYLEAARDFLASRSFDKFTVDWLVDDMLSSLERELSHPG